MGKHAYCLRGSRWDGLVVTVESTRGRGVETGESLAGSRYTERCNPDVSRMGTNSPEFLTAAKIPAFDSSFCVAERFCAAKL